MEDDVMFENFKVGFPEYYAPLPSIPMSLERMGLDPNGDYSPSKENLQKLMYASVRSIPFESLDCSDYQRRVDFAPPNLFEKIVLNRRGGYCFEINGFFMALLQGLGYDCFALSGRLLFGREVFNPMSHRTTVVRIDGKRYLCDVWYGNGCAEGPVDIDDPEIQEIQGNRYVMRHHKDGPFGDITLVRYLEDGTESLFYTVYLHPHSLLEFVAPNERSQNTFRTWRVVHLRTDTGNLIIDRQMFRRKVNGEVFEEEITNYPQLYKILVDEFKMIVPRYSFSPDFPREFADYKLDKR